MTNQTSQKVAYVFFHRIFTYQDHFPKSLPEILTFIFSKSACHAMRRFLGFLSKDCLSETTLCSAGGNHFPPQSFVLLTGRAAGAKWWHEHNVSPDSCREISTWFTGKSVEKWRHFNLMEILIDLIIYWIFIKALFFWSVYVCLVLKRPSPGSHQPAFFLIWDASTLFVGILNLLVATNLRHQTILSWLIGEFCLEARLVSSVSKCLGQPICSVLGLRSPSSCLEMRAKL